MNEMREISGNSSFVAMSEFLRSHRKEQRILVAASTDSSALRVLDAARQSGRVQDFAIAGQDSCF
jgi:ribose transport system substrate-binding protein